MMRDITVHPSVVRPVTWKKRVAKTVEAALRLIVPVAALVVTLFLAYLNGDQYVTAFDVFPADKWQWNPGYWLTSGHLILPVAFFVIALTNRRYGAPYAFAQVVISWLAVAILAWAIARYLGSGFTASPLPPVQITISFLIAMLLAQVVHIEIFDKIRGRNWWGAPFFSMMWAFLVFVVVFHPLAAWGMNEPWASRMVVDFVIKVGMAALLLVPYYLVRGLIKPTPGYGGA